MSVKSIFALFAFALSLNAPSIGPAVSAAATEEAPVSSHQLAEGRRFRAFWYEHVAPEGEQRELQQILDALNAASESGNPDAQAALGMLLMESDDEATRTKGLQWLSAAGKQGHSIALLKLGLLAMDSGDTASAFSHFENAAATGQPDANNSLGLIFLNGENVEPDAVRAADLFQVAAGAGHAEGQMRLAAAYWNEKGRARDIEEAYFWLLLAAPENARAKEFLPTVEAAMEPAQRDAVRARAAEWKPNLYVPPWIAKTSEPG